MPYITEEISSGELVAGRIYQKIMDDPVRHKSLMKSFKDIPFVNSTARADFVLDHYCKDNIKDGQIAYNCRDLGISIPKEIDNITGHSCIMESLGKMFNNYIEEKRENIVGNILEALSSDIMKGKYEQFKECIISMSGMQDIACPENTEYGAGNSENARMNKTQLKTIARNVGNLNNETIGYCILSHLYDVPSAIIDTDKAYEAFKNNVTDKMVAEEASYSGETGINIPEGLDNNAILCSVLKRLGEQVKKCLEEKTISMEPTKDS